jgi:hypothetical protein
VNDEKRGYKKHAIVDVLKGKTEYWLKSIKDEALRERVSKTYMITGGAIASMLAGDKPNDYDYYFTHEDVVAQLTEYYTKLADKKKFKDGDEYFPLVITPNAISLSSDVQLITRFVGGVNDIHKNFDFAHCINYYTPSTGLVLNQLALECILAKELKYVGSLYPVSSIFRMRKFIQRGWQISAAEMLKIAFDVSKLNLSDAHVLQEQMIGVDVAYFHEVVNLLKADDRGQVERAQLFTLLDKVFEGETIQLDAGNAHRIRTPSLGNMPPVTGDTTMGIPYR